MNSIWTPELTDTVIECYNAFMPSWQTAALVQERYGVKLNRSQICGKIGRLFTAGRIDPNIRREHVERNKRMFCAPVGRIDRTSTPVVALPAVEAPKPQVLRPQSRKSTPVAKRGILAMIKCESIDGGVPLVDLAAHHCKWPINDRRRGDVVPWLFCGARRQDLEPYCAAHLLKAWQKVA
jgi:hypothetical protein